MDEQSLQELANDLDQARTALAYEGIFVILDNHDMHRQVPAARSCAILALATNVLLICHIPARVYSYTIMRSA